MFLELLLIVVFVRQGDTIFVLLVELNRGVRDIHLLLACMLRGVVTKVAQLLAAPRSVELDLTAPALVLSAGLCFLGRLIDFMCVLLFVIDRRPLYGVLVREVLLLILIQVELDVDILLNGIVKVDVRHLVVGELTVLLPGAELVGDLDAVGGTLVTHLREALGLDVVVLLNFLPPLAALALLLLCAVAAGSWEPGHRFHRAHSWGHRSSVSAAGATASLAAVAAIAVVLGAQAAGHGGVENFLRDALGADDRRRLPRRVAPGRAQRVQRVLLQLIQRCMELNLIVKGLFLWKELDAHPSGAAGVAAFVHWTLLGSLVRMGELVFLMLGVLLVLMLKKQSLIAYKGDFHVLNAGVLAVAAQRNGYRDAGAVRHLDLPADVLGS